MKKTAKKLIKLAGIDFNDTLPDEKIADIFNIARSTLSEWRSDPVYKAEEERLKDEADKATRRSISRASCKAIKRLEDIIYFGTNEGAVVSACKDILDRAGYAPDKSLNIRHSGQIDNPFAALTVEQLERLADG